MEPTEAFRILASADRQLVLHELVARNGETTVGELSRQVAARRHRVAPESIGDEEIERARIRLVHAHLPRLVDHGIVDVDRPTGAVTFADEGSVDSVFGAATELDTWPPTDLQERPSLPPR